MPRASPIAVIMLTMKNDTEVKRGPGRWATVTMMDRIAMRMGRNAATRAPNTRMSTIIAAGQSRTSAPRW